MTKKIVERVLQESDHMIKTKQTIRQIAKIFNVSKSTVHKDLQERLIQIDNEKYKQIKAPKNYKCATCKNISICNPCPAQNLMSTGKYDKPRDVICKLTSARVNEFKKAEYDSYREELQEYKNKNQIIKSS